MTELVPVILLLFVAAITPGPNNFIVLSLASNGGVASALPAIAGIVLGSLALLALCSLGVAALVTANPGTRTALGLASALYLTWLGIGLIRTSGDGGGEVRPLPRALVPAAIFQLANPKSWLLVAAVSAASAQAGLGLPVLAILLPLVTILCLLAWAKMGASLSARTRSSRRTRLDQLMGLLLLAGVPLLFLQR